MCRRAAQGIRTGAEHSLTELVKTVGPGGNFMAEESTVAYLKNGEHLRIKHFSRNNYEGWKLNNKKTELKVAREKVDTILKSPAKANFTPDQIAQLDEIMARADGGAPKI